MFETTQFFEFPPQVWVFAGLCAILIGFSKAGIAGTSLIGIPILAYFFGGKISTGIMLPMLIIADIFAVKYYHRHTQWKYVIRLLPWALVGICIGVVTGDKVNDDIFKMIMGILVIACLAIMIWQKTRKIKSVPDYWWFTAFFGLIGGFATMMGNAAGPILTIFLLSMHLPKNIYIGTRAWFFFIVNCIKIPLHVFIWHTISFSSLSFNLILSPIIIGGVFLGIYIVKKLPENIFWYVIVFITFVASFFLF